MFCVVGLSRRWLVSLLIRNAEHVDALALRGSRQTLLRGTIATQAHTRLDPTRIQIPKSHAHGDLRRSTWDIVRDSWDVRGMRVRRRVRPACEIAYMPREIFFGISRNPPL